MKTLDISPELRQKIMMAESVNELMTLAEENNIEISEKLAENLVNAFQNPDKSVNEELEPDKYVDDEPMAMATGGCGEDYSHYLRYDRYCECDDYVRASQMSEVDPMCDECLYSYEMYCDFHKRAHLLCEKGNAPTEWWE